MIYSILLDLSREHGGSGVAVDLVDNGARHLRGDGLLLVIGAPADRAWIARRPPPRPRWTSTRRWSRLRSRRTSTS
jgi:hypothetical protein